MLIYLKYILSAKNIYEKYLQVKNSGKNGGGGGHRGVDFLNAKYSQADAEKMHEYASKLRRRAGAKKHQDIRVNISKIMETEMINLENN